MVPKFGNDFCAACEPIARIWCKGNYPFGRRSIAADDVYLSEIHAISLLGGYLAVPLTVSAV